MEEVKMPNQTTYLIMLIVSFILGILWGALSISPYKKMKAAIEAGDAEIAQANAKKIKIFFIVAIVLNALLLLGNSVGS